MAWIYLAASVDSLLPYKIGSNQLPIVKSTDTAKPYYCPECQKKKSHSHPFGMTCGCWGRIISTNELASTLYPRASRARTLALQEMELAWRASEVDFIGTSKGLSKKSTQDLYFSKMSQQLELGASTLSSNHLPSSGMTVAGQLYRLKKLIRGWRDSA